MTKRERVMRAMKCLPVDRPPAGFWFHFPNARLGQACIDAHLNYYGSVDLDFVKIMCDGYFTYPIPEEIKASGEWEALTPLPEDHPYIREQLERARKIKESLMEDMCVFYSIMAPFSLIRFGASDEMVMRSLRENPDSLARGLETIAETSALIARLMLTEAEMDGIYFSVQGGERDRMSLEEYRHHVTPWDLHVLEQANRLSEYNILHCCGWAGIRNRLEVWRDYPCAAVNWAVHVEEMPIWRGREFFGGKAVLGGFDNRPDGLLAAGSESEIREFTRSLLRDNPRNGLILGADCTLPADIDWKRIGWIPDEMKQC